MNQFVSQFSRIVKTYRSITICIGGIHSREIKFQRVIKDRLIQLINCFVDTSCDYEGLMPVV